MVTEHVMLSDMQATLRPAWPPALPSAMALFVVGIASILSNTLQYCMQSKVFAEETAERFRPGYSKCHSKLLHGRRLTCKSCSCSWRNRSCCQGISRNSPPPSLPASLPCCCCCCACCCCSCRTLWICRCMWSTASSACSKADASSSTTAVIASTAPSAVRDSTKSWTDM